MTKEVYGAEFDNGEPYGYGYSEVAPYLFESKEDCIAWIESQYITLKSGTKRYHYKYDERWGHWTADVNEKAKEILSNEDNINSFYEIRKFTLYGLDKQG